MWSSSVFQCVTCCLSLSQSSFPVVCFWLLFLFPPLFVPTGAGVQLCGEDAFWRVRSHLPWPVSDRWRRHDHLCQGRSQVLCHRRAGYRERQAVPNQQRWQRGGGCEYETSKPVVDRLRLCANLLFFFFRLLLRWTNPSSWSLLWTTWTSSQRPHRCPKQSPSACLLISPLVCKGPVFLSLGSLSNLKPWLDSFLFLQWWSTR